MHWQQDLRTLSVFVDIVVMISMLIYRALAITQIIAMATGTNIILLPWQQSMISSLEDWAEVMDGMHAHAINQKKHETITQGSFLLLLTFSSAFQIPLHFFLFHPFMGTWLAHPPSVCYTVALITLGAESIFRSLCSRLCVFFFFFMFILRNHISIQNIQQRNGSQWGCLNPYMAGWVVCWTSTWISAVDVNCGLWKRKIGVICQCIRFKRLDLGPW